VKMLFILFFILLINAYPQNRAGHGKKTSESKLTTVKIKEEARVPIHVTEERQQKIGLKVAKAERKSLEHTIRTVGIVTADERREAHVHTKIRGWIEQIHADYVGKFVKEKQSLFELYSPELLTTQEEYLTALKQGKVGKEIANAALERLKLWGVPDDEIKRLIKTGKSKRTVTFTAPVNGFIISKMAIQGMYIMPEMELYYIADLSQIWIIVTLYEFDLATVSTGDEAEIELLYGSDKSIKGKISYIYPDIDLDTRTGKARIEISNKDQKLKPGMFTNVSIKKDLGVAIVVPDDSVIDTGMRKIVFVRKESAHFEPREVKVGPRVGNVMMILSGLKEGEEVVTSAHFLIDSESKFEAATQMGRPGAGGSHSTH
jgi:membrane fusion protein, copper/silver efflux system